MKKPQRRRSRPKPIPPPERVQQAAYLSPDYLVPKAEPVKHGTVPWWVWTAVGIFAVMLIVWWQHYK